MRYSAFDLYRSLIKAMCTKYRGSFFQGAVLFDRSSRDHTAEVNLEFSIHLLAS